MKKLIGSIITAFVAVAAHAAGTTANAPTNVITRINFQLTFSSQTATNTTTGTKVTTTTIGGHKITVTNTFLIETDKAVAKPIVTKDVVAAIAPDAPKGAYLALVRSPGQSPYFAIRVGSTNFAIVTAITSTTTADVRNGKATTGTQGTSFAKGSRDLSLQTLTLTTATLTFNVTAASLELFTGDSISVGGEAFAVTDNTFSVIGAGSDALGANEIVTGTITANGAALGH